MSPRPSKRARLEVLDSEVQNVKNLQDYRLTDMPDAEVFYVMDFLDKSLAQDWYEELLKLDTWYQPKIKVYGKEILQSRKIAGYATDPKVTLKYSGHPVNMHYEYPLALRQIQDEVEKKLGVEFNHVMLNMYEDGSVYIGNHRDNIENRVIASVSLGAPRTFIMTHDAPNSARGAKESTKTITAASSARKRPPTPLPKDESDGNSTLRVVTKKRWTLDSGSLVVMQGNTQRYWKHEIPKEPKVKEGRISLTFRQLVY